MRFGRAVSGRSTGESSGLERGGSEAIDVNEANQIDGKDAKRAELVADGLLTIREVAEFLHLSRSKVYELMDAGDLCYAKLGRSRRIPRRVS